MASNGISPTSAWLDFFKEAGIPEGDAATYAMTFTDHRIQRNMLLDLNKDYLSDMGISVMGDVIAILKHAKEVHTQTTRDKMLRTPPAAAATPVVPVKRSTPASRLIERCLGNDSDRESSPSRQTSESKVSDALASRLGPNQAKAGKSPVITAIEISSTQGEAPKEEVPVPMRRRVLPHHEGKYKIKMPEGKTAKTRQILRKQGIKRKLPSVFHRLGSDSDTVSSTSSDTKITVTGLRGNFNRSPQTDDSSSGANSSIFKRLGGLKTRKRQATSTSADVTSRDPISDESEDGLQYSGILKIGAAKKKKVVFSTAPKKVSVLDRLGTQKAEVTTTSGVFKINNVITVKKRVVESPKLAAKARQTLIVKKKAINARLGTPLNNKLSVPMPTRSPASSTKQLTVKRTPFKRTPITSPVPTTTFKVGGVFGRLGKII